MTRISDSPPERQFGLIGPTTPRTQRLPAITRTRFGLFRFRSPLLTESRLLSLPVGTEMFHFPTFPPHALCVQAWVTGDESSRVSPFGNPRITVWLPTHRGLSQAPTSFIGSWCQGIHRMPLKTWLQITKMLASTVQFSSYGRSRPSLPTPDGGLRRFVRCGLVRAEVMRVCARSLRTQQRARPPPPFCSRFRIREDPVVLTNVAAAKAN